MANRVLYVSVCFCMLMFVSACFVITFSFNVLIEFEFLISSFVMFDCDGVGRRLFVFVINNLFELIV